MIGIKIGYDRCFACEAKLVEWLKSHLEEMNEVLRNDVSTNQIDEHQISEIGRISVEVKVGDGNPSHGQDTETLR